MTARTLVLVHGYTLADLDQLARVAVLVYGPMGMDWDERYDTAYSAIAEHLYAAEQAPRRRELVDAGRDGLYAVVRAVQRHHGYYRGPKMGTSEAGPGSAPQYRKYWLHATATASFEEQVLDRVALASVLAELPERDRQVLSLRATTEDFQSVALAMDVSTSQARWLVRQARKRALALWYDHETPRMSRGQGNTDFRPRPTRAPAPCGTTKAYRRHARRRERICDACREANRLYHAELRERRRQHHQLATSSAETAATDVDELRRQSRRVRRRQAKS